MPFLFFCFTTKVNLMKKLLALTAICFSVSVNGQTSTTIVQTIDLHLVNVIKIKFANTGTSTGSTVQLNLNDMSDLINGVKSANQNIAVSSTKPFNVNVKSSSQFFSYSGINQQNNLMPVDDVLKLRVNLNNTGGNIGSGYSAFTPIAHYTQNVINNGDRGKDLTFRVRYQAMPGLEYAAGNYQTSVIYTATQM